MHKEPPVDELILTFFSQDGSPVEGSPHSPPLPEGFMTSRDKWDRKSVGSPLALSERPARGSDDGSTAFTRSLAGSHYQV
jgi:hypothetical protein